MSIAPARTPIAKPSALIDGTAAVRRTDTPAIAASASASPPRPVRSAPQPRPLSAMMTGVRIARAPAARRSAAEPAIVPCMKISAAPMMRSAPPSATSPLATSFQLIPPMFSTAEPIILSATPTRTSPAAVAAMLGGISAIAPAIIRSEPPRPIRPLTISPILRSAIAITASASSLTPIETRTKPTPIAGRLSGMS